MFVSGDFHYVELMC